MRLRWLKAASIIGAKPGCSLHTKPGDERYKGRKSPRPMKKRKRGEREIIKKVSSVLNWSVPWKAAVPQWHAPWCRGLRNRADVSDLG